MSSSRSLQEEIESRLASDPHLSAFNIQVEAMNTLVTLRGVVPTCRVKLSAHEIAQSVLGCDEVINELQVRPALGVTDEVIADAVRNALDHHHAIIKGAITVQVEGGLVSLSGAVGDQREYAAAEEVARATRGVRDVLNLLIIDRDAQDADEKLRMEIQSAIDAVPELFGADISVAVSGDLIMLAGHVPYYRQKEVAGEVAYRIRPWRLRNDINVTEAPSAR